jgi:hypothetical protein
MTVFGKQGYRATVLRFAFWLGTVALLSLPVCAQTYKTLPIPEAFDRTSADSIEDRRARAEKLKQIIARETEYRGLALSVLKGEQDLNANASKFDAWFNQVVFAQMTADDEESLRQLATRRSDFFNTYVSGPNNSSSGNSAAKKAAFEHLVRDVAFKTCSQIVINSDSPTYAEAVKINAMLIINDLNLVEGKHATNPPRPLPEAYRFIVNVINAPALPDYLKAAAMIGFERHASLDAQAPFLADADRVSGKTLCATLLGAKPADRSEDLHYWMQRKAARIAGMYGDPGAGNEIGAALARVMSDTKARLWLRLEAAQAYGNLKFPNPTDANAEAATKKLGQLTLSALRDEAAWLQSEIVRLEQIQIKRKETGKALRGGGTSAGSSEDDQMQMMMQIMEAERAAEAAKQQPAMSDEAMMMMMMGVDAPKEKKDKEPEIVIKPSRFKHSFVKEKELPGYKLDVTRRRLKTLTMYLESSIGSNDTKGLARFAQAGEAKVSLDALRAALSQIEATAHMGVDDQYEAITQEMISSIAENADKLAASMGIREVKPAVADPAAPAVTVEGAVSTVAPATTTPAPATKTDEFSLPE